MSSGIHIWTVYERPRDWPEWFVARRFVNDRPTGVMVLAKTLEDVRELLPPGLTRLARSPGDDPVIVECWL